MFLGIIGFLGGPFLFVLQANGVEMNWFISAFIYAVCLVICIWTFVSHAAPAARIMTEGFSGYPQNVNDII